ncbi:IS66 family transposase [Victivallaceae bacterium BBE-744-WT-12]|uniref:IS66 family transposase n=1 Tax=Victivallis lenta TaxID=2606640 RepID=A0A844G636_9BACT|nr:IS66 family transposase [Victivallis lenta]
MPGTQGVGTADLPCRPSRLLCPEYRKELKKFLKDARLNIDNNPAERLNRGIAIIRKNCLFAGNEAGGQRLAILYSFAATCKANGICFRKWLEDVLPRLNSTPAGQIDSLIPKGEVK